MFSYFGQSYFSLPQSFSPFPYHGIIFLFIQHVLLVYVKFLVVYTTYCLDHISFQANCPNLWNVKIIPNKILPYEHYIFIFNTTHFCHVQMFLKFSIPVLQHKHHMWVPCRINPQDAGNRTRWQLPNPSVILGMIPTHCKAQGKTFSYVDHKAQEAHKVPSKYTGSKLLCFSWVKSARIPTMTNHLWKDIFTESKNDEKLWKISQLKFMVNFNLGRSQQKQNTSGSLTPPPPNKVPHLTRWRIGFQRTIHQSLVVYSIL